MRLMNKRRLIRKLSFCAQLILCSHFFAIGNASADVVQHSGTILAQTTWLATDVHQVSGQVIVNSGVTLTIELALEVIRVRRWLPDDGEAELTVRYELEYLPLSQRYIVRSINSGDRDSFATLYSALNNLGRIQSLPVIDDAILDADREYRIRLRASLSTRQYSAPFRFLFFWRDEWDLKSEWYEWRLER